MAKSHDTLARRFWSKVDKSTECWIWTGSRLPSGHGRINLAGRVEVASRVSFYLHHGRWPVFACHHCDVAACVNPAHIYDGDAVSNMADMIARGRHSEASKSHCVRGHEFTPQNTRIYTARGGVERACRACARERGASYRREARLSGRCVGCGEMSARYRCESCRTAHNKCMRSRARGLAK